VAIFGGDGCSGAQAEVRALAGKLNAPVGYSLKGKQWLEHDNPNAVEMTGLLGYGGFLSCNSPQVRRICEG
jgi:pyruvate dehydrogenase (quinone)